MQIKQSLQSLSLAMIAVLLLTMTACKKDTVYNAHNIATFSVQANDSLNLPAAIANNQIILYWPITITPPDSIAPVISVSANATISPASGTKVALKDGVRYVVKAENGETAEYTIKLVINQPDIIINEAWNWGAHKGGILNLNSYVGNLIPDKSKTSVYLVDKNNKETKMEITSLAVYGYNQTGLELRIPRTNFDTGWYRVKIISGYKTAISTKAYINVMQAYPLFDEYTTTITAKQGGTITLTGVDLDKSLSALIMNDDTYEFFTLPLVSATATSVTLKVPDDVTVGNYSMFDVAFITPFGGEGAYSIRSSALYVLSITAK